MVRSTTKGTFTRKHERNSSDRYREVLQSVVTEIKKYGEKKGLHITEYEMAQKINIPETKLRAYLNGELKTPSGLTGKLWLAYDDVLKTLRIENCRTALQTTIVWLRNIGLSKGMNITPEEMATKADITTEQLHTYLLNGYDPETTGDISFKIDSSYKELIKGIEKVEIIEDIDTIMRLLP